MYTNEYGDAWIDQAFYTHEYRGAEIPQDEFPRIAVRACQQVDAACGGKISQAGGVCRFPLPIQRMLLVAICSQVENLCLNGVETATTGASDVDGYNIGNTSVTLHAGSGGRTVLPGGVCESAYALLARTGLLYRGVNLA